MKYAVEVEVDQFQDKALKTKAKLQEVSVVNILTAIINSAVQVATNALIADALNTKLSKMKAGLALAKLEAMEE